MKFDIAFEKELLSQCLRDETFLKNASRILDAHHFSNNELTWLWNVARSCWMDNKEKVTSKYISHRIKNDFKDKDDKLKHIEAIKEVYAIKPKMANTLLDDLKVFVKEVNLQIALEKSVRAMSDGDIDKSSEILASYVRKGDVGEKDYTLCKWIEEFDDRQAERKYRAENEDKFIYVPTGIKRLDNIIRGVQPGELAITMGTTGRGKSISLTNFSYNAIKYGYKCVYFALEMPARQISMRQDARWLGIEYNKFKNYDFTKSELEAIRHKLERAKAKYKSMFRIVSMPLRSCNVNKIESTLEDLYEDDGFRPTLVVIDSADHLQATRKSKDIRVEQKDVYEDCKDFAEREGYAIWSSTQAGRGYADKIATAEATSESYDKARIADLIISLNEPEKATRSTIDGDFDSLDYDSESEHYGLQGKYMELFLAKYRDGESKLTIPVDAVFSKMLIDDIEEDSDG